MSRIRSLLLFALMVPFLGGCGTHELVLSRALRSDLTRLDRGFLPSHFRARVQMGRLEVWTRRVQGEAAFTTSLDLEVQEAAALCALLAESDRLFEMAWESLHLDLVQTYGDGIRWKNTYGHLRVRLSRSQLLEVRGRKLSAGDLPNHWQILAMAKVGGHP